MKSKLNERSGHPCWHSMTLKDAVDIAAKGSMYKNVYTEPELLK